MFARELGDWPDERQSVKPADLFRAGAESLIGATTGHLPC